MAAGKALAAGAISAKVVALTEGVIKAMLLTKLKNLAIVLVLATTFAGTGTIVAVSQKAGAQAEQKNTTDAERQPSPAPSPQSSPPKTGEKEQRDAPGDPKPTPEAKQVRTDIYGDPLPPGAIVRMGTVRFQHESLVTSVAFAPDGKTLVSAGRDKTVRLWEVPGGKEIRQFQRQHDQPGVEGHEVAFSPDGKTLVSACGDIARLWDTASGKEIHQFKEHQDVVFSVAFSPDGKTLASAGNDKTVRLWEVASGKEIRQFQRNLVRSVVFSPDGKTLASAGVDNIVRLLDVDSGKEIRQFQGRSAAFSPDGKTLATVLDIAMLKASADGGAGRLRRGSSELDVDAQKPVRLWDVASGKEISQFRGHMAAFSPDGKTLATVCYGEHVAGILRITYDEVRCGMWPAARKSASSRDIRAGSLLWPSHRMASW